MCLLHWTLQGGQHVCCALWVASVGTSLHAVPFQGGCVLHSCMISETIVCMQRACGLQLGQLLVTELPPVLLIAPFCRFKLWSAAPPCSEKGLTYAFLCYTAAGLEAPHLPPAVTSQHEEKQVSHCAESITVESVPFGMICSWRQDLRPALGQCWGCSLAPESESCQSCCRRTRCTRWSGIAATRAQSVEGSFKLLLGHAVPQRGAQRAPHA